MHMILQESDIIFCTDDYILCRSQISAHYTYNQTDSLFFHTSFLVYNYVKLKILTFFFLEILSSSVKNRVISRRIERNSVESRTFSFVYSGEKLVRTNISILYTLLKKIFFIPLYLSYF